MYFLYYCLFCTIAHSFSKVPIFLPSLLLPPTDVALFPADQMALRQYLVIPGRSGRDGRCLTTIPFSTPTFLG